MTHGGAAAKVRKHKEAHPEKYCKSPRCLWNVSRSGPCPKHEGTAQPLADAEVRDALEPLNQAAIADQMRRGRSA